MIERKIEHDLKGKLSNFTSILNIFTFLKFLSPVQVLMLTISTVALKRVPGEKKILPLFKEPPHIKIYRRQTSLSKYFCGAWTDYIFIKIAVLLY